MEAYDSRLATQHREISAGARSYILGGFRIQSIFFDRIGKGRVSPIDWLASGVAARCMNWPAAWPPAYRPTPAGDAKRRWCLL